MHTLENFKASIGGQHIAERSDMDQFIDAETTKKKNKCLNLKDFTKKPYSRSFSA
jgi:hypothetical protein